MKIMVAQCKQCGGQLIYIPNTLLLRCNHCSSEEAIELSKHKLLSHQYDSTEPKEENYSTETIISCSSCGAQFPTSSLSDSCPYCTSVFSNNKTQTQVAIDAIIPFKIKKEQAAENIKHWVSKISFAPNRLKQEFSKIEKLKGVYVPYYLVNTETQVTYKAKCGTKTLLSNKTHWTSHKGTLKTSLSSIALLGTSSIPSCFPDKTNPEYYFDEIYAEPWNNNWNWENQLPFHKDFLSGYISEIPKHSFAEILNLNELKFKQLIEIKVEKWLEKKECCDTVIVNDFTFTHQNISYRLILLPVWLSSFRFRNRLYQIAVNRQTGIVVGNRPYSKIKFVLLWVLVIALIFFLIYIFATESYSLLIILGIIFIIAKLKNNNK